jgi:uncharacterized coiled-coil protein SlyX
MYVGENELGASPSLASLQRQLASVQHQLENQQKQLTHLQALLGQTPPSKPGRIRQLNNAIVAANKHIAATQARILKIQNQIATVAVPTPISPIPPAPSPPQVTPVSTPPLPTWGDTGSVPAVTGGSTGVPGEVLPPTDTTTPPAPVSGLLSNPWVLIIGGILLTKFLR